MTTKAALAAWGSYDLDDPFPMFAHVREVGPVHPVTLADGHDAWLVVSYEEARAALNDHRLSKDMHAALATGSAVVAEGLPGPDFARHMLTVDPPDHTRLRRLVSAAFSPRRVESLRAHVQTIVDDLLDEIATRGSEVRVDLVTAFAFALPFTVICELLGVPQPERTPLAQGFTRLLVPTSTPAEFAAAKEASDSVVAMLGALVDAKQDVPGDDLVSGLITARDGDERLDTQELLSTIFQLIVAGHDTTASLIGNSLVALFRNPAQRLIAVAQDCNPDADLRVGDMHALPWDDGTFGVVTSFRGIWGDNTGRRRRGAPRPGAERPGRADRLGSHQGVPGSLGACPVRAGRTPKVQNQSAMVALGRPGAGKALLKSAGFSDVEPIDIPFVWELPDPEAYARALASTGPAFEAIQTVGEPTFMDAAIGLAREHLRAGLPLRAPIAVVGYVAAKPPKRTAARGPATHGAGGSDFLAEPMRTPEAQRMFDDDLDAVGYVTNVSRLWAYMLATLKGLSDLMGQATTAGSLTLKQRAVLVTAAASTLGDSYCSLAWGKKLADEAGPEVAAAVIRGGDEGLDDADQALAQWARRVAQDPNAIAAGDVQSLRDVGFDDAQIFAITTYAALRIAFSVINDTLGARPDHQLRSSTPEQLRSAVTFGRQVAAEDPEGPTR